MKKILFVGKFNEATKAIHSDLSDSYSIQFCVDSVAIVTSMLKMCEPDLVLINMDGMDENHFPLFEELIKNYANLPVLTFGTSEEYDLFQAYYASGRIRHVMQPTDSQKILEAICGYIGMDGEEDTTVDEQKLILLVDDSPVILRGMKQMLEDRYRIVMATSGVQAMQAIEKERPDAIILDYEMPECDGKETLEMIRAKKETEEIPVVFLTGHGDEEHIRSVLDLNPSAYFLKLPKAEKILEILGQLL